MAFNEDGSFSFAGTEEVDVEAPALSNTERKMIAQLCEEGGPLWRIMSYLYHYGRSLEKSLLNADFKSEEGRLAAIEVQASAQACVWAVGVFEEAMRLEPEERQEDE